VPGDDGQISKIEPVLGKPAILISQAGFSSQHQVEPLSKRKDTSTLVDVGGGKGGTILLVRQCFLRVQHFHRPWLNAIT
jgi:hypothetical protein